MSLINLFERELGSLGTGTDAVLVAEVAPRKITCEVAERNSLAVSFDELKLATTELAAADAARLQRLGQELSSRLTYLLEPISPIEIDSQGCVVQLRSNPPQRDDDGRTYYELLVRRGGEISLTRYRKENGNARCPITATVTREVLLRLVNDFCAILDKNL